MERKTLTAAALALGIAGIWGVTSYQLQIRTDAGRGDFFWAIDSARHLLAGTDPYGWFEPSGLMVPYPLPAALFGLPLAWLQNLALAAALFIAASSGLLAFGIARRDAPWRLLIFFAPAYLNAAGYAQWSPLITAAWFFPILAPLLVTIKPQTALPVALNRLTMPGVAIATVVLLASLAIYPLWPLRWIAMIGDYQRIIAVAYLPFGPLLLLAVLRWRDPKARLLLAMAILPFRHFYDLVALWLIPSTGRQMIVLVVLSWLPAIAGLEDIPFFAVPFLSALVMILWQGRQELSYLWRWWPYTQPRSSSNST